MNLSQEIIRHVPFLRRYARALTGTQEQGDYYVKASLDALMENPARLAANISLRLQLFSQFHETLQEAVSGDMSTHPRERSASPWPEQSHVQAFASVELQVLLLSTLERFSTDDIGYILGVSETETRQLLQKAKTRFAKQSRTSVLVIEDEPVIAFDIAGIVTEMGHRVTGAAMTKDEAVAVAQSRMPGLVLADIQLDDGSSGIDAVREILDSVDVPVIFVTAFPERLLTGQKAEPAYLVTKPFEPDVLKITIAQALAMRRDTEQQRIVS